MKSRKNLIKTILPALLCVMALLVAACGQAVLPPPRRRQRPTNRCLWSLKGGGGVADIATFDPGVATDSFSLSAIDLVFTGLVELDDNGNVAPYLASSWDVSSDNLTYTFHLRPNLKFSDGTPLTSADVAYSIDRALQPATKFGTGPYYLRYIKDALLLNSGKIKTMIGDSIKTPDANTISITASEPAAFFLDALTYPCSYVIEKSLVTQYGETGFTDHLTQGGAMAPSKCKSTRTASKSSSSPTLITLVRSHNCRS